MTKINKLNFRPLPGLSSRHLQTILQVYLPIEKSPPAHNLRVQIDNENTLSCEVSIPPHWRTTDKTVALVHGLGGSQDSNYMVRLAKRFYDDGCKVVRINLRGCGTGKGLARLPYNAGTSGDILQVLKILKEQTPHSEITVIGFSLGGSIVLKLAGELGHEAERLVKSFIAVCPPLDLANTLRMIEKKRHTFYHAYYLKNMCRQLPDWINKKVRSIYEFDDVITAPLWGYRGADEYYYKCSSIQFLPEIKHDTHLVFAEDDPFIPLRMLKEAKVSTDQVKVWAAKHGGHMGFIGRTPNTKSLYWMDYLLHNWIKGDFATNLH